MKVDFWVVVEARRMYWDVNKISSLKVREVRQAKPRLESDEIAVKVSLDVDLRAFTEPVYAVAAPVAADQTISGPALVIEQPPEEELTE